jgi:hypothetical protein
MVDVDGLARTIRGAVEVEKVELGLERTVGEGRLELEPKGSN